MTTPSLLDHPAYDLATVARLIGLNRGRVRRWLYGYQGKSRGESGTTTVDYPPIIERHDNDTHASFLDLIELLFARAFMDQGHSPQRLRKALSEAQRLTKLRHPFATKRFFLLDRKAFIELNDSDGEPMIVDLFNQDQLAISPVIHDLAKTIDFNGDSGLAETWHPLGKDGGVILDPAHAAGEPIIAGTGIRTAVLYQMYLGEGERADRVAKLYELKERDVMAAVRFESRAAQLAA